jgi:hypothetical protein
VEGKHPAGTLEIRRRPAPVWIFFSNRSLR